MFLASSLPHKIFALARSLVLRNPGLYGRMLQRCGLAHLSLKMRAVLLSVLSSSVFLRPVPIIPVRHILS
jgi:hypothetical protein